MQRYFLNESYNESVHEYEVTGEPFHHMIRVMRMEAGNHVYLVFANDMSLEAEIHQVITFPARNNRQVTGHADGMIVLLPSLRPILFCHFTNRQRIFANC